MELAFLLLIFAITLGIALTINNLDINTRKRCNELGVRHVWITEGTEDNYVLVCKKCKIHLIELNNKQDGGSDEY